MREIWKDIEGFEGSYQISSLGRVKSLGRIVKKYAFHENAFLKEIIMKPRICGSKNKAYYAAALRKDGTSKSIKIHRLVAQHFIPNPENKPEVNHRDGDKLNNNLSNLEWCTNSENQKHAYALGLHKKMIGANNVTSKMVYDESTGTKYNSAKEASDATGINYSTLKCMLNGSSQNKTTLSYLW